MRRLASLGICLFLTALLMPFNVSAQFGKLSGFSFGGDNIDMSSRMLRDRNGDLIVTGSFSGSMTLKGVSGDVTLNSNGNFDIFLLKFAPDGRLKWGFNIGGTGSDNSYRVRLDPQNNIYIAGTFRNTADFDPSGSTHNLTSKGNNDIFIAKYSPQGYYQWAHGMGGSDDDRPIDFDVNHAGDACMFSKYKGGSVKFDPGGASLTNGSYLRTYNFSNNHAAQNGYDFSIVRFDKNGKYKWGHRLNRINTPATGRVQLHPTKDYMFIFGSNNYESVHSNSLIEFRISNGHYVGVYSYHNSSSSQAFSIDDYLNDGNRNFYITGTFNGSIDFSPVRHRSNAAKKTVSKETAFIVAYDPYARFRWVATAEANNPRGRRIAVTNNGHSVFWLFDFEGEATLTPGKGSAIKETAKGLRGIMVAEFNSSGNLVNHSLISGSYTQAGTGIALDDQNEIYLMANYQGTVTLESAGGNLTLSSNAMEDVYLAHAEGCTDLVRLNSSTTICEGDSVLINGVYRKRAGKFSWRLTSLLECDTVVDHTLVVNNKMTTQETMSICDGQSVTWGDQTVSESGVFSYVVPGGAPDGCDLTRELSLTVNPTAFREIEKSVCIGDSVLLGNTYIKTAGEHTVTLQNEFGCDSVLRLQLNFREALRTDLSMSICSGDSLLFGGVYRKSAGRFTETLTSQAGCDSVVNLTLSVLPVLRSRQDKAICDGDSVRFGNKYFKATGTYYDTLQAHFGCDSISELRLVVNPLSLSVQNMDLCSGGNVSFGGILRSEPGDYFQRLRTRDGCDSTIMLTLREQPTYDNTYNRAICEGDSLLIAGSYRKETGTYIDRKETGFGCDSLSRYNLTVNPNEDTVVNVTICRGDSYFFAGDYRTVPGAYEELTRTTKGCDSLVRMNLSIQSYERPRSMSICSGDSILLGGKYRKTGGEYYDSLRSDIGCDSVIVTTLTVEDVARIFLDRSICDGDSLLAGGQHRKVSGEYMDVYTAQSGCDSIVTTRLTVLPIRRKTTSRFICQGDTVMFQGQTYRDPGIYRDTISDPDGCRAILTLDLAVGQKYRHDHSMVICQGDSVEIGGVYRKETGVYYDSLLTTLGCDSVTVLNLQVNPSKLAQRFQAIKQGEAVVLGGALRATSGIYYDTLSTYLGCDSVLMTELTVLPAEVIKRDISICADDSVLLQGEYQNTHGIYYDSLTATSGADSIVVTQLDVRATHYSESSATVGKGESYLFAGIERTSTGTYYDSLLNIQGCDSVIALNLTVLNHFLISEDARICQGERYFIAAEGVYRTTPGVFMDSVFRADTLYSINMTRLDVDPVFRSDKTVSIKRGDSVLIGGRWRTESMVYQDTLSNSVTGCDSILRVNLKVIEPYYEEKEFGACEGATVVVDGEQFTESSILYDTIRTSSVRDTIIVNRITIHPVSRILRSLNVCQDDSAYVSDRYVRQGAVTDSLLTFSGCDSLVITTVNSLPVFTSARTVRVCQGDSVMISGVYRKTAGTYQEIFSAKSNSCDSTVAVNLEIMPTYMRNVEKRICEGDSLFAQGEYRKVSGVFYDSLISSMGCDSIIATNLTVMPFHKGSLNLDFLSKNTICNQDAPIDLPKPSEMDSLKYSGTGVSGFTFDPQAAGAGTHTLVYSFLKYGGQCQSSDSVTINVTACLGAKVIGEINLVEVYPNPVDDWLTVRYTGKGVARVSLSLRDASGRLVARPAMNRVFTSGEELIMDCRSYAAGTYFLEILSNGESKVHKLIIER
ncbi:hypothetical protein FUAX_47000 (plasmid) [Fulvitalea axinellae]|uniref:Secretion system C-terminal sorting domain-containing protein n=1 Tax=Fulvitalea axinellae TaxID=1182444 RepID=A0AAU9CPU3_9BACT|nr:hypothetical protein FUAX_47000 [Fulvitalea axinellae]